jgi:acyl dehydratase
MDAEPPTPTLSAATAPESPDTRLHFEDFKVGDRWTLRPFCLDEAEIIEFGRKWDPQPFHTDPVAARSSPFGGLIASGIHTIAAVIRAQYEDLMSGVAAVGGVGFDSLRFRGPVRPGQLLHGEIEVLETSARRPDRGWGQVTFQLRLAQETGEELLRFDNRILIWYRDASPAG